MYAVETLTQGVVVVSIACLGVCFLIRFISAFFNSNAKGTKSSVAKNSNIKSNKNSYKHKEYKDTKTHTLRNHQLRELKKVKLIQGIHNQGRELGMLITTIENINKPFEIKGTVFTVADPMDQNAITYATQTLGTISLSDIKKVLVKRLTKETHKKGGNAVIGLRLFQANEARDIFAYGTAVKIN